MDALAAPRLDDTRLGYQECVDVLAGPLDADPPPRLTEPPLVAVEVVSPTSRERDLAHKRAEYAASATGEKRGQVAEPFAVELHPTELV